MRQHALCAFHWPHAMKLIASHRHANQNRVQSLNIHCRHCLNGGKCCHVVWVRGVAARYTFTTSMNNMRLHMQAAMKMNGKLPMTQCIRSNQHVCMPEAQKCNACTNTIMRNVKNQVALTSEGCRLQLRNQLHPCLAKLASEAGQSLGRFDSLALVFPDRT